MKTTISGSFRKHLDEILEVIAVFEKNGIDVLSPQHRSPKNPGEEFVLFEGEQTSDPKELEEIHLNAIKNSDFLYVVDPEGYVGNSAIMEVGYAKALGKPIYSLEEPRGFILKFFVQQKTPSALAKG